MRITDEQGRLRGSSIAIGLNLLGLIAVNVHTYFYMQPENRLWEAAKLTTAFGLASGFYMTGILNNEIHSNRNPGQNTHLQAFNTLSQTITKLIMALTVVISPSVSPFMQTALAGNLLAYTSACVGAYCNAKNEIDDMVARPTA